MTGTGTRCFWKRMPRLYKNGSWGAEWKQPKQVEASIMVKGTNRRVIVVRSPDPKLFEEAIFVLREDGKTPEDPELIMTQAARAAGDYLKKCGVSAPKRRSGRGLILIGAALLLAAGLSMAAAWYYFF